MSYYLNTETATSPTGKAKDLVDHHGAKIISQPESFNTAELGRVYVCVVSNGPFDASALIYNQGEFDEFTREDDPRHKTWLTVGKSVAYGLSGYVE